MPSPRAILTVNGPGHSGTRLLLQEGITSFGRLPSNDVVLIDDLVSRHHARITFFEGRATLQDLGSHNGSYINGQRIDGNHPLAPGDMCRVGPFQILFRISAEAKAEPKPSSSLLDQIEAARRRTDEHPQALQVLLRATEALAAAPEIDDYIGHMMRLALEQTHAQNGAYLEQKTAGVEVLQVGGPDGAATDVPVTPAVVEWSISKNYPVRVDDLADDLRFSGPSMAVMCVPVTYGGDVLGAYYVTRVAPPFEPEALDTLVAVAHLTGLGIQASRARRTAVRARLAEDTLARTFHPQVAAALARVERADARARHATVLRVRAEDWTAESTVRDARARIAKLIEGFCRQVEAQEGQWHIGPGPALFAVFEDEAGPTRALTVADDIRSVHGSSIRAAITRGTVFLGVSDGVRPRVPLLAGPGLDAADALVDRVPAGLVWMDEASARLYPGPQRPVAEGAYLPT